MAINEYMLPKGKNGIVPGLGDGDDDDDDDRAQKCHLSAHLPVCRAACSCPMPDTSFECHPSTSKQPIHCNDVCASKKPISGHHHSDTNDNVQWWPFEYVHVQMFVLHYPMISQLVRKSHFNCFFFFRQPNFLYTPNSHLSIKNDPYKPID